MNINATLFAQFIVFFTLVWVVMKFIWPPLIKAIDERRAQIAEGLQAAQESMAQKASGDSEVKALLKEAKQEASSIVSMANKRAEDTIEASRDQAKAVAEKQMADVKDQIVVEMNQAKEQLRKDVVNLALEGAGKILGQEVNRETHERLLQDLASRL